jgi:ABC-type dipeptide/oligopeptide/nickel transport system permease component
MEQPENANLFDLHLDQPSMNYLNEAARWGRFLSILGFIYCGLMVILAIFFGSIMGRMMSGMGDAGADMTSRMGGGLFGFVFIAVALIMFFPALFLYNFSTKMRRALNSNDQPFLTEALKNLKSLFKFYGIIAIIVVSFYALALIGGIIGGLVGRH